jgi:hypothetical protein
MHENPITSIPQTLSFVCNAMRTPQLREESAEKEKLAAQLAAEQAECEAQRRARAAAERDLAAAMEAARQVGRFGGGAARASVLCHKTQWWNWLSTRPGCIEFCRPTRWGLE